MNKTISIIHPSRSRPELAKQTYDEWMGKAANPDGIEYILSIDADDSDESGYLSRFDCGSVKIIRWDNNSAIDAINTGAQHATEDILVVVSDDFSCPDNWDIDLLAALEGKEDFCVKTWDGAQPWIMTLPIMDRAYYERFGYIYPPQIRHMFADTWVTHVADLLDRTVIVPMEFRHRHYSQKGGIARDAVSIKNDKTWMQGELAYLEGVKNNFGLNAKDIKGVLRCDINHAKWLQSKGIKIEYS